MSRKYNIFLTISFGILGNALLLFLAYQYIFVAIETSYASLLSSHEQLSVLEKKGRALKELEATVLSKQTDFDRINNAFLHSTDIVAFVETLESIATVSSTTLTINSASTELDGENTGRSVFIIALTGTYTDIQHYIELLEYIPFHARIRSASMNQPNSDIIQSLITIEVLTLN